MISIEPSIKLFILKATFIGFGSATRFSLSASTIAFVPSYQNRPVLQRKSAMIKSRHEGLSLKNSGSENSIFRDYAPQMDEEHVLHICKDVYGGRDYLPRMLCTFSSSPVDFPMVLCNDKQEVVAVGNLQMLTNEFSWIQVNTRDKPNYNNNATDLYAPRPSGLVRPNATWVTAPL